MFNGVVLLDKNHLTSELHAGDLTLLLEPNNGFLRYIRLGDFEVCRGICFVRRKEGEPSLHPIRNLKLETTPKSFRLAGALDDAEAEVLGDSSGKITIRPTAGGISILLPIAECAGKSYQSEEGDGSVTERMFPGEMALEEVLPPFRALTFEPAPGARVEIRTSAGSFEFIDQRGRGGASFRLTIEARDAIITLRLLEPRRKVFPVNQGRPVQVSIVTTPVYPKARIGWQRDHGELSPVEVDCLKPLRLDHLRVSVDFQDTDSIDLFKAFLTVSRAVGTSLHIAARFSSRFESELDHAMRLVEEDRSRISLWVISVPENITEYLESIREKLVSYFPNTFVGLGPCKNLQEFADSRFPGWAAPCYSLDQESQPRDEMTLIENLACQRMNAEGGRKFSSQSAVVSVTLPASSGLFPAAWLIGSLSQLLTAANIRSLTYVGSLSQGESILPVYHVLASIAAYERIYSTQITHPLQAAAISLLNAKEERRIIVANFLTKRQEIKIKTGSVRGRVRYLDEESLGVFTSNEGQMIEPASGKLEVSLGAYALAFIDLLK